MLLINLWQGAKMNIGISVSDELYNKLKARAEKDERSIAGEIRYLLAYAIAAIEAEEVKKKQIAS